MNWDKCSIAGLNFPGYSTFNDNGWHNSMWSTMFSGGAGPGLFWGSFQDMVHTPWDNPSCWGGQYRYFAPLHQFLQGDSIFYFQPQPIANTCTGKGARDFRWFDTSAASMNARADSCGCTDPFSLVTATINPQYASKGIKTTRDSLIEVFGLKIPTRVIGWIHHKRNYWYELPHKAGGDSLQALLINDNNPTQFANNIPFLTNDSVTIEHLAHGSYRLDFYSTWPDYEVDASHSGTEDGGIIPGFSDTIVADCNGNLSFRIPTLRPIYTTTTVFAPDYGFKLTWLQPVTNTDITANTTWNKSAFIPGDVTVNSGATLTISGSSTVITMPEQGKIIVKPGGKLLVDSATVTSDCDSMWQGIVAEGNPSAPQSSANQPTVEINHGTIANARMAVQAGDMATGTNGGGIVKASHSSFINNAGSAAFAYYRNYSVSNAVIANQSRFTNCRFTVNNSYRGHAIGVPFDAHVRLWSVEGLRFYGCGFYNHINTPSGLFAGYGIRSRDAAYSVLAYCTGMSYPPCSGSWQHNVFKGFNCGVLAEGTFNTLTSVTIDEADFDSCSIGVRAKNQQDIAILRSRFDIGNGPAVEATSCIQNIGTYTTGSYRFRVEENQYAGHTHGGQPSGWKNIGAITQDAYDAQGMYNNNDVYKNSFEDLHIGAEAVGNNSSPGVGPGNISWDGLRYRCNSFYNNDYDMAIEGTGGQGIATFQGTMTGGNADSCTANIMGVSVGQVILIYPIPGTG